MKSSFSNKKAMPGIAKIGAMLLFLIVLLVVINSTRQPANYLLSSDYSRQQAVLGIECDSGMEYSCLKIIKNCDNIKDGEKECSAELKQKWEAYKKVKDCEIRKDYCNEEEEEAWNAYKEIFIYGEGSDYVDASKDVDPLNQNQDSNYKGDLSKDIISDLKLLNLDVKDNIGELVSWNDFNPKRVVLHHTGGKSASSAVNAMGSAGYSVHYVVDKDGTIYQYVDLDKKAAHACGSNHETIGIEIVNSGLGEDYTDKQYESINGIVTSLENRLTSKASPFVIGHFEVDKYYASNFNSRGCSEGKWDPSPNFVWAQVGYPRTGDVELASQCSVVKNDRNLGYSGDCYDTSTLS